MKNFKSVIAILTITLVTSFSANAANTEPAKTNTKLRTEIVKHLGSKIPFELKEDCKAEVSFMLNNKNEIIVLSVDTAISEFDSYVKSKLNYKRIKTIGVKKGEIYKMPVKLNSAK